MRDHDGMTRFDRFAGEVAWCIFWAVIGGVSSALKIYYIVRPDSRSAGSIDAAEFDCLPGESELEIKETRGA
jgi:hypothetical protein